MSRSDDVTSFVRVGPTRVRVRTHGSGPPLLMIMGIGGNLDMWDPLVPHLPGRELLMFDFPGTGNSGISWLPPTMAGNAWFVKKLIRVLGHARLDVLGYSWGGLLAQHLAIQHRGSVDRLVLAATTYGLGARPPGPVVASRMLTPRRYYSRPYFKKIAPHIYGGRYRVDPVLANEDARRRVGRPPSLYGYMTQLAAVTGYSTLPGLPLICAPTLIIAGNDDPIAPSVNAKVMARLIRRSELHILEGAGHMMLFDSPEISAPLVSRFLAREPTSHA
ncbi:alpha/beta fold hydrolase [Nocardioides pocheonensis]|uniref:Alpha/beta fold hydrolase n=1 Tax=Nocardioides pocheonensis TaxID=661485 RepID=A0A3N0GX68_9ACTN|nr:alpha/beta fold hydrolase [Nocardioides pocheonensis]RNM17037.1 alpha/beta fold hydrolase [Nocardioides pocheonensis]